ncbi:MAG TPA: hypothetical protein VLJ59_10675 [Mycobacteriales bacterium]|nr:hypothetical protein [Mycobacteriales bacterium]
MSATMVFVHGRGQEFKDPAELVKKWQAGLAAGLVKAGAPAVSDAPVVLPYYGNLLYRITAELAQRGEKIELEALPADPDQAGPLHPQLPRDVGALERQLVGDMADVAGAPLPDEEGLERLLSWGGTRRALTWLSQHSAVDQEIIKSHLRDVAVYLTKARDQVLELCHNAIPSDVPIVLVSHSLGTVVARDLLDDADLRGRTVLWVTAGSPLGLEAVQKNLLTKGAHSPGVEWLTTYDVNDIVALGHALGQEWGAVTNIEVENGDSPHSIERYLGHPEVAGPIGTAVAAH